MLVKLNCGIEIEADKDALNDMRVLELLASDDPIAFVKVLGYIMSKEQKDKLYDHIAKENNGKVPVDVFAPIFEDMLSKMSEQDKDVKN